MLDKSFVTRKDDNRFPIPDSKRYFRRCPRSARQRNDRIARKNVDVVSRKILFAAQAAIGQMRVDRQLHELVRIAGLGRAWVCFAAGDNPDADPTTATGPDESTTHGFHYSAPST